MRHKRAMSLAGLLVLALVLAGCFSGTGGLVPGASPGTPADVTAPQAFPGEGVRDGDLAAHVPGQLIVGVDSEGRAAEVAQRVDGVVERYLDMGDRGIALVELNDAGASLTDAMRSLKGVAGVRFAEANFTDYTLPVVKDQILLVGGSGGGAASPQRPFFDLAEDDDDEENDEPVPTFFDRFQYGPRVTRAVEAWARGVTGKETVIAIIDTGVDPAHPSLVGKVLEGYNPDAPELGTDDWQGHGTHVASTAAGHLNLEGPQGFAGIAPDALVLPLRVFNSDGASSIAIAEALLIAADPTLAGLSSPPADVANMSLGGAVYSQALQDAVHFANDRGVVVVASSGNEEHDQVRYPAAYQGVIAVAATNARDEVTDFSTGGHHVSVGAPGDFVFAGYLDGSWAWASGTSMAAPHVSGAAALVRELHPDASPAAIKELLERTADPTGESPRRIGAGRLNVARALDDDATDSTDGIIELYVFDELGRGVPNANVVLYKGDDLVATGRTGGYFEGLAYDGMAWFFGLEPGDDYRLAVSLEESLHNSDNLYEVEGIEVRAGDVTFQRVRVTLSD